MTATNVHVSNISSLPIEILTQIFSDLVPLEFETKPPYQWTHYTNTRDAPVLFTRVCHRWRHITLVTPTLWTSLSLKPSSHLPDVDPSKSSKADAYLHSLSIWLSASGTLPLRVKLQSDSASRFNTWLISLLCDHAQRWKAIDLGACTRDDFPFDQPGHFPLLESFFMDYLWTPGAPRLPPFLTPLQSSPSLREIHISHDSLAELPLPWSTLTAYRWKNHGGHQSILDMETFVNEMNKCIHLKTVSFSSSSLRGQLEMQIPRDSHRATLPQLRQLAIGFDAVAILEGFLNVLKAPQLEGFALSWTLEDPMAGPFLGARAYSALQRFLSPSLRAIRLQHIHIPRSLLLQVFQWLPNIERMYFVGPNDYTYWVPILDALIIPDHGAATNASSPHPSTSVRLQDFGIYIERDSFGYAETSTTSQRAFFEALSNMVESRRRVERSPLSNAGIARLETLRFSEQTQGDAVRYDYISGKSMLDFWAEQGIQVVIASGWWE